MSKLPVVLIVLILVICGFFTRLYFVTKASLKNQIKNAKLVTEYSDDTTVEQMDTVTFGIDSDGKPIEWIVLRKQGNKALLLSKYLLAGTSYDGNDNDITWENCGLRQDLNSDFMKQTFSKNEQNSILTVDVLNMDNEQYGTKGGNNTKDKIFLLSIDQFELFFPKGSVAKYKNGKVDCWWLRSPGERQDTAMIVDRKGDIFLFGFGVQHEIGVRPALWVEY